METVDFKKAPEQLTLAAEFLRDYANRVKTRGSQIQIDGAKHKEVKLLLHKYLRHRGLDGYRVLSQSGIIEIVPPHVSKAPTTRAEGSPPSAAATMPYFFPGAPPVRVERKVRKKIER